MPTSAAAAVSDSPLSLLSLLKQPVIDSGGKPIGRLDDIAIRLQGDAPPQVTGFVISAEGERVIPAENVSTLGPDGARLAPKALILASPGARDGELLLKKHVLGHRLIDVARGGLVKAYDVRLAHEAGGWKAVGFDVHKHGWFSFGAHEHHPTRDWGEFELLIGDKRQRKLFPTLSRIRRLKPAQIADIIESASTEERDLLLAEVHADPELEADVFEELEDDRQAHLLKTRSDPEIADVLARMRADDAADAVMSLPQSRRQPVLELLPHAQRTKVQTLLGFNHQTAGGLMGTDYLAVPADQTIEEALGQLRRATTQQLEALTTIHSLHPDGRLAGTLGLVRALQLDPAMRLSEAADAQPVVASPDDDIIAVTTRMADYNLLSLPVLDSTGRLLGIVTVDDALEAAIPRDWTRRVAGHRTG